MKPNRPKLKAHHFYAQFPNEDKPHHHSSDHQTKEWWDMYEDVPHSKEQISFARGGDVMHTRKVPKPHTPVVGERPHKSRHPAMMIPGIHVIEGIHGIPYFTGKK